jgi:hypothetical protein
MVSPEMPLLARARLCQLKCRGPETRLWCCCEPPVLPRVAPCLSREREEFSLRSRMTTCVGSRLETRRRANCLLKSSMVDEDTPLAHQSGTQRAYAEKDAPASTKDAIWARKYLRLRATLSCSKARVFIRLNDGARASRSQEGDHRDRGSDCEAHGITDGEDDGIIVHLAA